MTQPKDRSQVILFVVNDAWFFKSHRLPIAEALIKKGCEVHLAAHTDQSTEEIEAAGVQIHHWKLSPRSTNPLKEARAFLDLARIIFRINPGLLHLVTIKSVLYGGILSRLMRVKSVIFAISGLGYIFRSRDQNISLLQRISLYLYKFALNHNNSAVIVQNQADGQFFTNDLNINSSRVWQLPGSGVDTNLFKPGIRSQSTVRAVLAARMLWDKGIRVFADAARILKLNGTQVECVLVGGCDKDNPRGVPEEQLRSWESEGILTWAGHSKDMVNVLQQADIFCLPTMYGEGLPKVVIEAAACSCAIVVSDWPGCRDIIENEKNGLLLTPGDPEALSKAITQLAESPTLRDQLGSQAHETVANGYTIQIVIDMTLSIYRQLQNLPKN